MIRDANKFETSIRNLLKLEAELCLRLFDSDLVLAICEAKDRAAPSDAVDKFAVQAVEHFEKLRKSDASKLLFHRCKVCFGTLLDIDPRLRFDEFAVRLGNKFRISSCCTT